MSVALSSTNHMECSALSCGKCGATFKYKRNLAKHALLGQCGRKRGPAAKSPRKSNRKAANGVHNEPIPISRFRVSIMGGVWFECVARGLLQLDVVCTLSPSPNNCRRVLQECTVQSNNYELIRAFLHMCFLMSYHMLQLDVGEVYWHTKHEFRQALFWLTHGSKIEHVCSV